MKNPTTRQLFDYWNAKRGRAAAPDRSLIAPGDIRELLPLTFIISCEEQSEFQFRLAGSQVCGLFGRELRGSSMLDLFAVPQRRATSQMLRPVATEAMGLVCAVGGWTGDMKHAALEMILLPLVHNGVVGGRALGALSPMTTKAWMGAQPIEELICGSLRYLRSGSATMRLMRPSADPLPLRPGRARGALTIHDGGRL
ncbi:MAG TPA: PAS domain-containing protein [Xanthobacteraceae bacterium]|jgi:hypothetical protein|nr:PAS domain-containing protein [Xanthobacteraceae bacterium]